MASDPKQLPSGLWFIRVNCRGQRPSRAFASKTAAKVWAQETEKAIRDGKAHLIPADKTVVDLLDRYENEVTCHKRGAKQRESSIINITKRDPLGKVRLSLLDSTHTAAWQTRRLTLVKSATVRRERNLLQHAFETAVSPWHWLTQNPFGEMKKNRPKDSKPRDRIATDTEIEKICGALDEQMQRIVTFALETGCRQKEIATLKRVEGFIAYVDGKTGPREVPLSGAACKAWEGRWKLSAKQISVAFAEAAKEAGVKGLRFHDLRHTALTKLSRKLDPYELSKMAGADIQIVMKVYYKQDINEMVRKLSGV